MDFFSNFTLPRRRDKGPNHVQKSIAFMNSKMKVMRILVTCLRIEFLNSLHVSFYCVLQSTFGHNRLVSK